MAGTRKWQTRALPATAVPTLMGAVTLAGQSRGNRGIARTSMRVLGSYALVYVTAGQAEFGDAPGLRRTVRAGDVMLLFPDVAHFYDPGKGEPWDDIWLVFNGPVFDQWRQEGWLSPEDPVWRTEPVDYWRQRVAGVLTGGAGAAAAMVEVSRLLALLAELRAAAKGGLAASAESWLAAARTRLDEAAEIPDWEDFSREFGLSYDRFRRKFSAALGVAPAQYRLGRRIDRAAEKLATSDVSLKEIATELGFCDEFHFSKLFKRRTGLSPSAYRTQVRGG